MEPIVETVDPEIMIGFGSSARATITPESDGDMVVVKDVSVLEAMKARGAVYLPTNHPPVHIVPTTRKLLSDQRGSRSWVYGPGMAEGSSPTNGMARRAGEARAHRTGSRYRSRQENGWVRILYYQREEGMDWLNKAEQNMQVVRSGDTTIGARDR